MFKTMFHIEILGKAAALLILAACAVGPDYAKPEIKIPDRWQKEKVFEYGRMRLEDWWKTFGDSSLDILIETARDNNPDIKIAEKNIDLAKGNYLPSITANANVGVGVLNFDGSGMNSWINTPTESAGISVSVPIFNRGATKANVKKSKIALEQAQLDYEQTQLASRQTVVQAYRNVVSSFNAYRVSKVKENAYSKSFDAYNTQFRYGTITAVDLLQQQNNYLNALNSYIQNKYSLLMKRKILDVYMGEDVKL